ncbi:hypothetical protein RchiOBHm_Chr3g0487621 [Rosa chinensis]|uniref:Uncharacterized protein n=1 Tax=Rosa chinensis TaxID=74649 RepID=A0A2P6RFL7_ROSCH|nr:hypothetical protein RchiOBHm_Chr3g0487621 [Rosa chinensis]
MLELSVLDRGDVGFTAAKQLDSERCKLTSDWRLGLRSKLSRPLAMFLSAIIVNPLDVAKMKPLKLHKEVGFSS